MDTLTRSFEMMWKPETVFQDEKTELLTAVTAAIRPGHDLTLFVTLFWEPHPAKHWHTRFCDTINEIKSLGNVQVVFACNSWYKQDDTLLQDSPADHILYVPYFMITVFNRIFNIGKIPVIKNWNSDANKFLFLSGKPQKQHRIRMLYKIINAGLKDCLEWSFFMPQGAREVCHALLPELTLDEFNKFVEDHIRSPDDISVFMMDDSLHYSGIPFDPTLFKNSLFQVVSECYWEHPGPAGLWATEKTWISMVNKQPFILVSDTGSLAKLTEWGFRTFTKYLKIPNYDTIEDDEQRLNAVLENIEHWNLNIHKHTDAIRADVSYNYAHYTSIVEIQSQRIQSFLSEIGVFKKMHDVIPFYDHTQNQRWSNFYNNIKDDSWPACEYEEAFYTLPIHIQKECIDVFGFKPIDT